MREHTPSPWVRHANSIKSRSANWVVVRLPAYTDCVGDESPEQIARWDADARIIATAPELLQELEDRYHDTQCGCGHPACRRCQADARTLAVINKAKGETE